jgi:hypothetical protein
MRFGRAPQRHGGDCAPERFALSDDIKLFAATFLCGFVFVSILIG